MIKYFLCGSLIFCLFIMGVPSNSNYITFKNDPAGVRMYTLENGLTVYLAKNQDEPKIQTFIAVRAGSNYDPSENTGLAHYLEHMLFKGTSKFGCLNWQKESVLIERIAALYERHKAEKDPAKKKLIYKEIDSISYEASTHAIPNEYDQMISAIGGEGTNAHTWFEETVYKNKIPTNSLEKWLAIESERFSTLVLRLFHTELEAVYEEFNMGQSNDDEETYEQVLSGLFAKHPYGQQTTIGTSEHLKNPSMKAIQAYFKKYYVPNNMAVVLVGDLEFEPTIELVKKYFGGFKKAHDLKHPTLPKEEPLQKIVKKEISGPNPANILLAYRAGAIGTKDEMYLNIVSQLLHNNGDAGLMDIELNQKQKVQASYNFAFSLNDYGIHFMGGIPKANQTLEEVEKEILQQLERIKKGDFDDWMLSAIISNLRLTEIKETENATSLAKNLYETFVHFQDWQKNVDYLNNLSNITKQDIIDFANRTYTNYAIVYKKQGENNYAISVEKPQITPVKLNQGVSSAFNKKVNAMKSPAISPLFIDYQTAIQKQKIANLLDLAFVENKSNELYSLTYIINVGSDHIKELPVAVEYANLLGTDKYSPEQIKQEFFKYAVSTNIRVTDKETYFTLSGLFDDNFETALSLFEHYIHNLKMDTSVYQTLVQKIAKDRMDEKSEKSNIVFSGLLNMGLYGNQSRLKDRMAIETLQKSNPQQFVDIIKKLTSYQHSLFYYGRHVDTVATAIQKHHALPTAFAAAPPAKIYKTANPSGQVYVADYDMVQSEFIMLRPIKNFDNKNLAAVDLFSNYFGSGLSSVVFRELRESKALAYSAAAIYRIPIRKEEDGAFFGYIGTQVDKLPLATKAMSDLLNNDLNLSKEFFEAAKSSSIKKIESDRITKSNIFWSYKGLLDRGIDYDIRKQVYADLQKMTMDDLKQFFDQQIKQQKYNYAVLGSKKKLDFNTLEKLGNVKHISVDELFDSNKAE